MTNPANKGKRNHKENEIIQMTRQVIHNHYERQIQSVTEQLADDVVWIGPFDFQWTESLAEFKHVTASEYREPPVKLTEEEYHLLPHTSSIWIVYGKFLVTAVLKDAGILCTKTRITFIWKRKNEKWKISHMHVSNSQDYLNQEPYQESKGFFEYLGQFIPAIRTAGEPLEKLSIRDHNGCYHYLFESEILRIEASNTYCRIILYNGSFMVRQKISELESSFSESFVRIHRSHLVNLSHIYKLKRYEALLSDGTKLPISRDRYMETKNRLKNRAKMQETLPLLL